MSVPFRAPFRALIWVNQADPFLIRALPCLPCHFIWLNDALLRLLERGSAHTLGTDEGRAAHSVGLRGREERWGPGARADTYPRRGLSGETRPAGRL